MTSDETRKRIAAQGGDPLVSTPEEYAADIARESAKWGPLIRRLGLEGGMNRIWGSDYRGPRKERATASRLSSKELPQRRFRVYHKLICFRFSQTIAFRPNRLDEVLFPGDEIPAEPYPHSA